MRSSNFILLGRHCTYCLAATCNPAFREGQPRMPGSAVRLGRSHFCQYLVASTFTVRPEDASTLKAAKYFHGASWRRQYLGERIVSESRLSLGQSFPPLDLIGSISGLTRWKKL